MTKFNLSEKRKELRVFMEIQIGIPNLVKDILNIIEKQDKEFIKEVEAIMMNKEISRRERIERLHKRAGEDLI